MGVVGCWCLPLSWGWPASLLGEGPPPFLLLMTNQPHACLLYICRLAVAAFFHIMRMEQQAGVNGAGCGARLVAGRGSVC